MMCLSVCSSWNCAQVRQSHTYRYLSRPNRLLDPLELELQVIVGSYVGVGACFLISLKWQ